MYVYILRFFYIYISMLSPRAFASVRVQSLLCGESLTYLCTAARAQRDDIVIVSSYK